MLDVTLTNTFQYQNDTNCIRKQINGHMLKLTIHERTERRITVNTSCEGRDRTLPVVS